MSLHSHQAAHAEALRDFRTEHHTHAEETTSKYALVVDELRSQRQATLTLERSMHREHGQRVDDLASDLAAQRRGALERENALQVEHARQLQNLTFEVQSQQLAAHERHQQQLRDLASKLQQQAVGEATAAAAKVLEGGRVRDEHAHELAAVQKGTAGVRLGGVGAT